MPFLPRNILSSLFVIVTSSSSSLATTVDLASLLLRLAVVILVAIGGGGGGGGKGGGGVEAANNYTDRLPMWPPLPHDTRGHSSQYPVLNAPRAGQLNRSALRTRLGADFDPDWMSIDEPYPLTGFLARDAVDPDLADELRELDFSYADERGDQRTIPSAVRGILERWLVQRATCRVRYAWRDLGVTFWPRWIKHGYCDEAAACSWPSGMHCVPAESDTIRLFHWHCRWKTPESRRLRVRRSDEDEGEDSDSSAGDGGASNRQRRSQKQLKCQWKRAPYPITSDCFCAC